MKKAVVEIPMEFLAELLRLPEGVHVEDFFVDRQTFTKDCLWLKLNGDALGDEFERREGEQIAEGILCYDHSGAPARVEFLKA